MISINKGSFSPEILRKKGKNKRRALCSLYTRYAKDYNNGIKKFNFDSSIYGHTTVKESLIKAQHDKCCFCESKICHITYGDVEHFRPKGGVQQQSDDPLEKPGYYWLAYDWANLFFSCQICNQRYKKNLFPLKNPDKRARTHQDELSSEAPLFIDPSKINPENHISFRDEIPFAIEDNPVGKETIKAMGLDREALNERRRDRLEKLKSLQTLVTLGLQHSANAELREVAEKAQNLLRKAAGDSAEYAAMTRAVLKSTV